MKFKFKDISVEEIINNVIVENDFNKTINNLKNVVLLMNFEKNNILKQKVKKYFIPNLIFNIREQMSYEKKIIALVDKSILSFNISKEEFFEGIKSGKY